MEGWQASKWPVAGSTMQMPAAAISTTPCWLGSRPVVSTSMVTARMAGMEYSFRAGARAVPGAAGWCSGDVHGGRRRELLSPLIHFFLSMEGGGVVGPAAGGQRGWREAALDLGFCWQVTAGTTKRVVFGGRSWREAAGISVSPHSPFFEHGRRRFRRPCGRGQRGWREAALDLGFCWQVTAGTTKRVVFGGRSWREAAGTSVGPHSPFFEHGRRRCRWPCGRRLTWLARSGTGLEFLAAGDGRNDEAGSVRGTFMAEAAGTSSALIHLFLSMERGGIVGPARQLTWLGTGLEFLAGR